MKIIRSVFRGPDGNRVFDPAQKLVVQFNIVLGFVRKASPDTADLIDHLAEEIAKARLSQPNQVADNLDTDALYHEESRPVAGLDLAYGPDKTVITYICPRCDAVTLTKTGMAEHTFKAHGAGPNL